MNMIPEEKMDSFLFKGLVIVLIVVLGLLLVYSYLNVKPETFTQVYLIPDKIVNSAVIGEKIPIEFEIDNREGKAVNYSYVISVKGEEFLSDSFILEDKQKNRIEVEIIFNELTDGKEKVLIEVFKENEEEPYSIWFWIEVK